MILYNVTVKIDHSVHDEWLKWMRNTHIPDVLMTGLFKGCRITCLLGHDETDGKTYAFQYTCADMETLQQYLDKFAPALQQQTRQLYDGKFVAFRSILEILEEIPVN